MPEATLEDTRAGAIDDLCVRIADSIEHYNEVKDGDETFDAGLVDKIVAYLDAEEMWADPRDAASFGLHMYWFTRSLFH